MNQELLTQVGEFVTQFIAFVVFFFVMAKYAWPAIDRVLAERQRQVDEGFADIDRKKAEAQTLFEEYQARLREIEAESRQKIQAAVDEGKRVAKEITDGARAEADSIIERTQRNMEIELAKARVELRNEIVGMTIGAAEKLLRQKVNEEADRNLVNSFIQDIEKQAN